MEDSPAELRKRPTPYWIFMHGRRYFPKWDRDSQLRRLNGLLPLTDAGSAADLIEVAEENDLILAGDQYALRLKDTRSGVECAFRAKCGPAPEGGKLVACPMNSDLAVEYRIERTVRDGNTDTYTCDCKTLFGVRRDAETNPWFETGSWDEIRRRKTPAVTTYEEIRNVPVCTGTIEGKSVFRTFRLTEDSRSSKLGKLDPRDIVSSPSEENTAIPQPPGVHSKNPRLNRLIQTGNILPEDKGRIRKAARLLFSGWAEARFAEVFPPALST